VITTPSGDLVIGPRDAALLARALGQGILALDRINGGAPSALVQLYGEISKARSSPVSETGRVSHVRDQEDSAPTDTEWLSIAEAATLAGWSPQHIRTLCRKRSVIARRSARGWWLVDRASLVARLDGPMRPGDPP
jgi:hypothetical protein